MTFKRTLSILFASLLCVAALPLVVIGQDEGKQDLKALVLASLDALRTTDYAYTYQSTIITAFISEDDASLRQLSAYDITGQQAADGQHSANIIFTGGDADDEAARAAIEFERVVADETVYLKIDDITTLSQAAQFPLPAVAPGWWRLDDLAEALKTGSGEADRLLLQVAIGRMANAPLITDLMIQPNTLVSVTEAEGQVMDEVVMRVFDLEMDGLAYALSSTPSITQSDNPLADLVLLSRSEFTVVFRLWIGADDGLLYGGEGEMRTYLPYTLMQRGSYLPFDLETVTTLAFSVTAHGVPVTIEAPALTN